MSARSTGCMAPVFRGKKIKASTGGDFSGGFGCSVELSQDSSAEESERSEDSSLLISLILSILIFKGVTRRYGCVTLRYVAVTLCYAAIRYVTFRYVIVTLRYRWKSCNPL